MGGRNCVRARCKEERVDCRDWSGRVAIDGEKKFDAKSLRAMDVVRI